ncbi:hypothetical protein DNFV4_03600 [Nitrospira tepida]|uniref:Uncharacterized protein n=1 Tax=Nitrospira tepida TaxID=2973512 RepID=A0AA86T7R6_9BACT|nr:hypothetical protein [Nitrospira tepida]CAI4033167.1 hypothetical protein DNFV4_03600 [Nitrospira tepida]
MEWINSFFSLDWMDAMAVILGFSAICAGTIGLWRRFTENKPVQEEPLRKAA